MTRDLTADPEREASRPRFPAHPVAGLAGTSFKPQHLQAILAGPKPRGFFEIHAENYMGAGGPPHRALEAIRRDHRRFAAWRVPVDRRPAASGRSASCPFRRPCCVATSPRSSRSISPGRPTTNVYYNDLLPLPLTRGDAGVGVRPHRSGAGGDPPTAAARKSVDLCAVPRIRRCARRTSSAPSPGAPAAASCSTSTTCSCRRPTTASRRSTIWPIFRSGSSAKSISPDTPNRATTRASRC